MAGDIGLELVSMGYSDTMDLISNSDINNDTVSYSRKSGILHQNKWD